MTSCSRAWPAGCSFVVLLDGIRRSCYAPPGCVPVDQLSPGTMGPVAEPAERSAPSHEAPQGRGSPMGERPLSGTEFSAVVAAVTSAFGDPTRRQVYLYVREAPAGVTASQVAGRFSLHPNVARHHLDKLAAGGYLEVFSTRAPAAGAGRPSKRYRRAAQHRSSRPRNAVRSSWSPCSERPRALAPGRRRGDGRKCGFRLRPQPRCFDRARGKPTLLALSVAGDRRRPDGPRVRRASTTQRPLTGPRQRGLPLFRRGCRAPRHLRRRQRNGEGHAEHALRCGRRPY